MKRWPLVGMAIPAAIVVWTGWVGLGTLCGFRTFHPFGIAVNTALALPIGVEAYGAYALGAWLQAGSVTGEAAKAARDFARASSIGALVLGMLGQVAYHLMAADHDRHAPALVIVFVSCLPVVTLGFGAGLGHLLARAKAEAAAMARPGVPPPDDRAVRAALAETKAARLAAEAGRQRASVPPPARAAAALPPGPPVPPDVAADAEAYGKAVDAYQASVKAGKPVSARYLAETFGISRRQTAKIIKTPVPLSLVREGSAR